MRLRRCGPPGGSISARPRGCRKRHPPIVSGSEWRCGHDGSRAGQRCRDKLRFTNAVERHHEEVRRRTRVIRIFPHEASLLRWLTALAIEQNDHWRGQRWLVEPTFIEPERPMRRVA
ncbi:MAG: transposase [Gemmatimonadales bacterium]